MPEMVLGQGFRMTDILSDAEEAFQALYPSSQQEFLALHNHKFPTETSQSNLLTIIWSNAYNTGTDDVAIFPKISRINHSCVPNAGNFWSEKTKRRIIYAMCDIEAGEEITVTYAPLHHSIEDRQTRLVQYGFVCDCAACQSSESNDRRVEIGELLEILEQNVRSQFSSPTSLEELLAKAIRLVNPVEEEDLDDYLARVYRYAAILNEKHGDLEDAKEWAKEELEVHQLTELDSAEALAPIAYVEDLSRLVSTKKNTQDSYIASSPQARLLSPD